jgi:hypothetical protein
MDMIQECKDGEIDAFELGERIVLERFAQNQLDGVDVVRLLALIARRSPWIATLGWFGQLGDRRRLPG